MLSDDSRTFIWDARNRLSAISGGVSAAFTYDALGRRLAKTVAGATRQFVYDGLNPVQERSTGSAVANLLTGLESMSSFAGPTRPASATSSLTL